MQLTVVSSFQWFRCPDGYRLTSPREISGHFPKYEFTGLNGPLLKALFDDARETVIVPNSGRSEPRKIREDESLYLVFSHVKTTRDLIAFFNNHGPLIRPLVNPHRGIAVSGDDAPAALEEAQFFRSALLHNGKRNLSIPPMLRYKIEHSKRVIQRVGSLELELDPSGQLALRLKPPDLRSFLFWQLAQQLLGGTRVRECKYCGTMFEAGRGSGRRADAIFCCKEHKVRFLSLSRSRSNIR